jgi:chemotaxis protein histidine kinase CheA
MARQVKSQPESEKPAIIIPAVFQDEHAHCAIRVDLTTNHTFFVENNGTEFAISKMKTQDFNHRFRILENYDVVKAAQRYLRNIYTPVTGAARQQLLSIVESDMSEPRTFRAPSAIATGAKTLPNKVQPAKTEAAKVAASPKETQKALKTALKTTKTAQAEAKAEAKKEPKSTPLPKKEASMASTKKTDTKKPAAKAAAKKAAPAKKPAAKAKAAPAKKPAAKAKAESVGREDRSIETTGKANECREGSFCFAQVKALQSSKTVSEAQTKLDKSGSNTSERRIEVAWAVKMGYIKLV